jgi:hypothetical protein
MPLCFHAATFLLDLLLTSALPASLELIFTSPSWRLLSSQQQLQQQQVSLAYGCDGACGKHTKQALPVISC